MLRYVIYGAGGIGGTIGARLQQAGEDESKSWQHGCMFTAGVLISFLVLAGILIGLRAGPGGPVMERITE